MASRDNQLTDSATGARIAPWRHDERISQVVPNGRNSRLTKDPSYGAVALWDRGARSIRRLPRVRSLGEFGERRGDPLGGVSTASS